MSEESLADRFQREAAELRARLAEVERERDEARKYAETCEQTAQRAGDAQINHMVDRFLGWNLPEDFSPDAGISFEPTYNKGTPYEARHRPIGTNLLNADQAKAMVRHMLEGLPSPTPPPRDEREERIEDLEDLLGRLEQSAQLAPCESWRSEILAALAPSAPPAPAGETTAPAPEPKPSHFAQVAALADALPTSPEADAGLAADLERLRVPSSREAKRKLTESGTPFTVIPEPKPSVSEGKTVNEALCRCGHPLHEHKSSPTDPLDCFHREASGKFCPCGHFTVLAPPAPSEPEKGAICVECLRPGARECIDGKFRHRGCVPPPPGVEPLRHTDADLAAAKAKARREERERWCKAWGEVTHVCEPIIGIARVEAPKDERWTTLAQAFNRLSDAFIAARASQPSKTGGDE